MATLDGLAKVMIDQGQPDMARLMLERAIEIAKDVRGIDHKDVAYYQSHLIWLMVPEGKYSQAAGILRKSLSNLETAVGQQHPQYTSTLRDLSLLLLADGQTSNALSLVRDSLGLSIEGFRARSAELSPTQSFTHLDSTRKSRDLLLSFPLTDAANIYGHVQDADGLLLEKRSLSRLAARSEPEIQMQFNAYQKAVGEYASLQEQNFPKDLDADYRDTWMQKQELKQVEVWNEVQATGATLATSSEIFGKKSTLRSALNIAQLLLPTDALIDYMIYDRRLLGPLPDLDPVPHLVAFVTTVNTSTKRIELGAWEPIKSNLSAWRESHIGVGNQRSEVVRRGLANAVSAMIWEPIRKEVEHANRLLISPDRELALVPWASLPENREGRVLLDENQIILIPSVRLAGFTDIIEDASRGEEANSGLLVVGGIDYGSFSADKQPLSVGSTEENNGKASQWLQPLIAAKSRGSQPKGGWERTEAMGLEVDAVLAFHQLMAPDELRSELVGISATEAAFKEAAPGKRWIHLATHGFYQPLRKGAPDISSGWQESLSLTNLRPVGRPPELRTGVVLAGANNSFELGKDDGLLTAWELASVDLTGVELVVLAACQTAEGEAASGEGLLSLQRSLTAAGVRNSITSLWEVDDGATLVLMERFYFNLLQDDLGVASALSEAQRWLRGQEGIAALKARAALLLDSSGAVHPMLWAGWVVAGEPEFQR